MILLCVDQSPQCLARQETVPFYRSKGTVYIVWFMGVARLQLQDKASLARFTDNLYRKAQMTVGAQ
jgi:hypothetical protein